MSAGVVPRDEITLKEEESSNHKNNQTKNQPQQPPQQPKSHLRRGILNFQQLNALALVVVLSASGMVALEDLVFVVLSFFYMFFLSKVAFPTLSPSHNKPVFSDDNHLLSLYCFLGAVVGLFLPVAYIFEGILEGDKEGIRAATPHVFLLASQLFLEGVAYSDRFSPPLRVLVPVVYNSTRIFTVMQWVKSEVGKVEVEGGGGFVGSRRRLVMGRVLAIVNMVYWSFNLLGFLLPVYLPRAFKRYYSSDPKNVKD